MSRKDNCFVLIFLLLVHSNVEANPAARRHFPADLPLIVVTEESCLPLSVLRHHRTSLSSSAGLYSLEVDDATTGDNTMPSFNISCWKQCATPQIMVFNSVSLYTPLGSSYMVKSVCMRDARASTCVYPSPSQGCARIDIAPILLAAMRERREALNLSIRTSCHGISNWSSSECTNEIENPPFLVVDVESRVGAGPIDCIDACMSRRY